MIVELFQPEFAARRCERLLGVWRRGLDDLLALHTEAATHVGERAVAGEDPHEIVASLGRLYRISDDLAAENAFELEARRALPWLLLGAHLKAANDWATCGVG